MNRMGPMGCGVNRDTRKPAGRVNGTFVSLIAFGVAAGAAVRTGVSVGDGVGVAVGSAVGVAAEVGTAVTIGDAVGEGSATGVPTTASPGAVGLGVDAGSGSPQAARTDPTMARMKQVENVRIKRIIKGSALRGPRIRGQEADDHCAPQEPR